MYGDDAYLMCRQIFDKLITDFEWKVFAILYEGTDSLFRTHRLLERWDAKNHGIFLYHLGTGPSYRWNEICVHKSISKE